MPSPKPPRVIICLATYNEKDNLAALLKEISTTVSGADILVIDDNSPDGTGLLADELRAADSRIHVLHRAGKLGLGTAILTAMRYAIDNHYDHMVNMDADFSHHPRYLPAMLAGMRMHDIMIGSRYIPGGGTRNWPWSRQLMSIGVSTLARVLMRLPARDTSGGYRCYAVSLLKRVHLESIISRGYSLQEEVLYRCRRAGCRMGETPIIFEERRAALPRSTCMKRSARWPSSAGSVCVHFLAGIGTMTRQGADAPRSPLTEVDRNRQKADEWSLRRANGIGALIAL